MAAGAPAEPTVLYDGRYGRVGGAWYFDSSLIAAKTLPPTGPKPFAMGIEDHLDDFARTHGATNRKLLDDVTQWNPSVLDKLADPHQRVLLNLDDVPGLGVAK